MCGTVVDLHRGMKLHEESYYLQVKNKDVLQEYKGIYQISGITWKTYISLITGYNNDVKVIPVSNG